MADFVNGIPQDTKIRKARVTIAFDGAAGNGAVGTVDLFTITGRVLVTWFSGFTTESLAGANAELEAGSSGDVDTLIANTVGTLIDVNEWWQATPVAGSADLPTGSVDVLFSSDIILTIGVANVTNGTMVFDVWFTPITDDGNLVAA